MEKTETTSQRSARMKKKFEKIVERRKQKVRQDMLKTVKKRTEPETGDVDEAFQKWERGLMKPGLRKANIAAAAREPTVKRKTISKPSILKEMDQYKAKKVKGYKKGGPITYRMAGGQVVDNSYD
tara:strand:+ start:218 stop:592 length:375 start_codon:yes stop_codon:yes gene_type:complete